VSKICRNHLGTQEFRPKKGKKWDKKKTERKIEVTLVFSYDIALKILPPTELTATQLLPKKIHLLWDNPDGVWPPHRVYPVGVFFSGCEWDPKFYPQIIPRAPVLFIT